MLGLSAPFFCRLTPRGQPQGVFPTAILSLGKPKSGEQAPSHVDWLNIETFVNQAGDIGGVHFFRFGNNAQ